MNISLPKLRILRVLSKSQLGLFEKPVQVQGSVDKHGIYRQPHTRIMRVRSEQGALFDAPAVPADKPAAPKGSRVRLDTFVRRHGGVKALAALLAGLTPAQSERIVTEMAALGGMDAGAVRTLLGVAAPAPAPAPAAARSAQELHAEATRLRNAAMQLPAGPQRDAAMAPAKQMLQEANAADKREKAQAAATRRRAGGEFQPGTVKPSEPGVYELRDGTYARFDTGIWWRSKATPREALLTEFGLMSQNRDDPDYAWRPHAKIGRRDAFGTPISMRRASAKAPTPAPAPPATPAPAPLAPRDEDAIANRITQRAQTIANNASEAARRVTAKTPERLAGALRAEAARLTDGAALMPNEELRQSNMQAADMLRHAADEHEAQQRPAAAAPTAGTAEWAALVEKYGLPPGAKLLPGKGTLGTGKWIASAGDISGFGGLVDTPEQAAQNLAEALTVNANRKRETEERAALAVKVRDKLRSGEKPTEGELKALFGLEDWQRYVWQEAAGWFLVEYMGVPRNKIRATLGVAGGMLPKTDGGVKYPVVYPRRLHEVFGPGGAMAAPAPTPVIPAAEEAVRTNDDGATQADSQKPNEEPSDEELLTQLFGNAGESEAAFKAEKAQREERRQAMVQQLRQYAQEQEDVAQDWASRQYKTNGKQIELSGDGPRSNPYISVSGANESRRRRNVEAAMEAAKAAHALADRLASDQHNGVFVRVREVVNMAREAAVQWREKNPTQYIEQAIASQVLGDPHSRSGPKSIAGMLRVWVEQEQAAHAEASASVPKFSFAGQQAATADRHAPPPNTAGFDFEAMRRTVLGDGAAASTAAPDTGPKEGDTKPAADGGTLVLRDGRWQRQDGGEGAAAEPAPAADTSTLAAAWQAMDARQRLKYVAVSAPAQFMTTADQRPNAAAKRIAALPWESLPPEVASYMQPLLQADARHKAKKPVLRVVSSQPQAERPDPREKFSGDRRAILGIGFEAVNISKTATPAWAARSVATGEVIQGRSFGTKHAMWADLEGYAERAGADS